MFSKIERALTGLKDAFLEVPDMLMSVEGACRLTGLDEVTCQSLLMALEHGKFLWRSRSGLFKLRAGPTIDDDEAA